MGAILLTVPCYCTGALLLVFAPAAAGTPAVTDLDAAAPPRLHANALVRADVHAGHRRRHPPKPRGQGQVPPSRPQPRPCRRTRPPPRPPIRLPRRRRPLRPRPIPPPRPAPTPPRRHPRTLLRSRSPRRLHTHLPTRQRWTPTPTPSDTPTPHRPSRQARVLPLHDARGWGTNPRTGVQNLPPEGHVKRKHLNLQLTERQQLIIGFVLVILVAISMLYCLGFASVALRTRGKTALCRGMRTTTTPKRAQICHLLLSSNRQTVGPLPTDPPRGGGLSGAADWCI